MSLRESLSPNNGPRPVSQTDSFDAFCRQYLPVLERYLVGQAHDSGWAAEIAQECMLAARGRWDNLLTAGQPDRWLFEAATRELRRLEARAGSPCRPRSARAGLAVSDLLITANSDGWVYDHLDVIAAIRSLPRRQAEAVGLHYLVGYSIAEVAKMLGICVGAAQAQLDRGTASLARWEGEGPAAGAGAAGAGVAGAGAVAVTRDDLHAAGATIGVMSAGDLNRRLRRLEQRERSLTGLAELRRQAELDSAELEQAAYQLAGKYRDEGDLVEAARWYRMAAARDFSDASLELAKVLDRLSRTQPHLLSEARLWHDNADAAGHLEPATSFEVRSARRDQDPDGRDQDGHVYGCPRGGLAQVMQWQLTAATVHVGTCRGCQNELLSYGGMVPAAQRAPAISAGVAGEHQQRSHARRSSLCLAGRA